MTATGRGAWSTKGMPINGTRYYQYLTPVGIGSQASHGPDFLATHYAVLAIQKRINALGYMPKLAEHAVFDAPTDLGVRWAQKLLGLTIDGQFGPKSALAFFWPVVRALTEPNVQLAHTVGGIARHESGWDPGAVGEEDPDDHGLVQINRPANKNITLRQAYNPNFAFQYCANRIEAALKTFGRLDIAICSYASPQWAQDWAKTGHSPNQAMTDYTNFVMGWNAPS